MTLGPTWCAHAGQSSAKIATSATGPHPNGSSDVLQSAKDKMSWGVDLQFAMGGDKDVRQRHRDVALVACGQLAGMAAAHREVAID
jgi:hypothetical protein